LGWKLGANGFLDLVSISWFISGVNDDKNVGMRKTPLLEFNDVTMGYMPSHDSVGVELLA